MGRPIVFVSHSAKEPEAVAARTAVVDALEAARCDVRVDQQLQGGEEWRAKIERDMAECESAVVVLSPAALVSEYVPLEVAVLKQHQRASALRGDDPPFAVVPLLVGVTRDELERPPFRASALTALQLLTWPADVPDRLLGALAALIDAADARERPDHELEQRLLQQMEAERLTQETIRSVGEKLGLAPAALRERRGRALARGLLAARHADQLSALLELKKLAGPSLAEALYEYVAPHSLVRPEAADVIRSRAREPERRRGAGINCTEDEIPQLYVRRASFEWSVLDVGHDWSDDFASDILDAVCAGLAERLGYRGEVPGHEELNERMADRPLFLLLPEPLPGRALIDALREKLGNLVLLVRCTSAEDLERKLDVGAEYVLPELADGEEHQVLKMRRSAILDLRSV